MYARVCNELHVAMLVLHHLRENINQSLQERFVRDAIAETLQNVFVHDATAKTMAKRFLCMILDCITLSVIP